tara:strand:+ start:111278 stop:111637 length:360 start_codon:yes stop_codon:yes gene_type:complete
MAHIYHILKRSDWERAKKDGSYHPISLNNEGFIHCSKTDQIKKVADSFYKSLKDLIIIRIEEESVEAKVVHEPPLEAPMSEVLFPHIYGELNIDSVDKEIDFPCSEDGSFELPDGLLGD